jgi:predicted PurR-regulated permease PerM
MTGREGDGLSRGSSSGDLTRSLIVAVLVGVGAVLALILAYQALSVLKVIAVALLLAVVLRTAVMGLERLGVPPLASAFILLAGVAAFGALMYFVLLPSIAHQVRSLISEGPGSLRSVSNMVQGLPFAPDFSEIIQQARSALGGLIGSIPQILSAATGALTGILTAIFLAIYLAINPDAYIRGILRLVPEERRAGVEEFIGVLGTRLRGWISGTVIVACFVGVIGGLGLWVLGIPLALTFGILAGILDIIPLFGSILGGALPTLMALTISPVKALEVVVLFVVINQIEGNFLQPQIMGRQIHVPPAMILVSILFLGTLLGPIIGTLLAIPAAVVVVTLVDQLTTQEDQPEGERTAEEAADARDGK